MTTARTKPPAAPPPAPREPVPVTMSEYDGVRYLHLGTDWVQGAMRIGDPLALELEYVQRMMVGLLWRDPARDVASEPALRARGTAVQLGLGAAALTKFTRRVLRMPTVAVELNPQVIGAARLWFALPKDDTRLQVQQADAAQWVADPAHHGRAALLQVDLYDHEAAAPVLDDEGFYADCRRVLAEGGVMTVNLFGRAASFDASAARIAAAFAADTTQAASAQGGRGPGGRRLGGSPLWMLKPTREGNTIVVATRGVPLPARGVLALRAANIEQAYGLPARQWLRLLKPWTDPR